MEHAGGVPRPAGRARPTKRLAALLVALVGAAPAVSRGQQPPSDPSPAEARREFRAGIAAADRGRWEEARARFERSLELRPTPVVAHNLALALVRLGRRADAWNVLTLALGSDPASEAARRAARLRSELEPHVARLRLRRTSAAGAPVATDLAVSIEGRAVPLDGEGFAEVAVEPGRHELRWARPAHDPVTRVVEVAAGALEVVLLDATPPPPPARPVVAAEQRARARRGAGGAAVTRVVPRRATGAGPRSTGVLERWWFWTAVGVVVLGAAGAGVAAAAASGGSEPHPGSYGTVHLR